VVSLDFEVFLAATATAVAVVRVPIYPQTSTSEATNGQKRVAITDSSIAGPLVDYRLYDKTLDTTVYETAFQVKGRINSTWFDDRVNGYTEVVETGARVFSANDLRIQAAIDRAGLKREVI
jgi:hypothetical protein